MNTEKEVERYEFEKPNPIKGYPELYWRGKRPFTSTQYYPAQLKERYGEEDENGWINKIFWGDNLQVMSHMLKEYRGKINLIYIDPPFDSNTEYKKTIKIKGQQLSNDINSFEEKQYTDIWINDEYLQFMYERIVFLRELLSEDGSIYLHCDWHKAHHLRCIMEDVFGFENFRSQIVWKKTTKTTSFTNFGSEHDILLYFCKNNSKYTFNQSYTELKETELINKYVYLEKKDGSIIKLNKAQREGKELIPEGRRFRAVPLTNMNQNRPNLEYEFLGYKRVWAVKEEKMKELYNRNYIFQINGGIPSKKGYLDENKGAKVNDVWIDINPINSQGKERVYYPTQKPEKLLERIIKVSSNPGDLVFDCFMGSGTTQTVAMKMGRRFIGSDINLGSIQTTTKRLLQTEKQLQDSVGFEVYNVNNYDIFKNDLEAKELLEEALGIQILGKNYIYDGELDGRMVKIMPVNRIATRADLGELIAGLPYKEFEKRKEEHPNLPVEKITLVCMGHEADLKGYLQSQVDYNIDVEIVDILRDKTELEFKRESEAKIIIDEDLLVIHKFYPRNLLQKMSILDEDIDDWRQLVESVAIDFNYDGAVMEPSIIDIPERNELVKGKYKIPKDAGVIKVKITDVLSETFEWEGAYEYGKEIGIEPVCSV